MNDAKKQIELLQGKSVGNDIEELWRQANTTKDKVQEQETKQKNDMTTLQKAINDTIDKCNAGDASLTTRIQTQETKERNDVTTLQKAINDTIDKCTNVNNTLTAKVGILLFDSCCDVDRNVIEL